jgi:uncharacterized membrane protein YdjX (TVP38/TMEM64 family)/rhodanese-related sulfurtransferase
MNSVGRKVAVGAILLVGIILAVTFRDRIDVAAVESWLGEAGWAAPLIFMVIYALASPLFVPGSILTLAGGALFGPWLGTFWNLTGATAGAGLSFLVARYLASDWVQSRTGGRLGRLIKGVEAEGWRFVAFTRLVPLFPYNLLNYALGLTRIPFLHYLLATYVFMLPGALVYTYLGYAGREAIAGGESILQKALIALALLAALAFVPRLIARLRERPVVDVTELRRRAQAGEGIILDVRAAADFIGDQGHIRGALNIPLEELATRVDELGDDPECPIAVVCRTDRRSGKAAALLGARGFGNVQVVRGGMTAWREHGWPVVEAAADQPRQGS